MTRLIEILNGALFRAGDLQTPMTEDTLENVAKLDKLLKGIKAHSPDTYKCLRKAFTVDASCGKRDV
jgi:hypothetical protein